MSEGFLMDPWIAMLFFRVCRRYGVEERQARIMLLRELARRKEARYLRDAEGYMVGKRVLKIENKKEEK